MVDVEVGDVGAPPDWRCAIPVPSGHHSGQVGGERRTRFPWDPIRSGRAGGIAGRVQDAFRCQQVLNAHNCRGRESPGRVAIRSVLAGHETAANRTVNPKAESSSLSEPGERPSPSQRPDLVARWFSGCSCRGGVAESTGESAPHQVDQLTDNHQYESDEKKPSNSGWNSP